MNIESVKMDFSVRDIKMGVNNIANGNSIIREFLFVDISYLNLVNVTVNLIRISKFAKLI